MSLRVFIGTANAGKTGILHTRLRERVGRGQSGALLVPSAPDVARDLAELARDIPVGLAVTTLDAHLDHLWRAAYPDLVIIGTTRRMQILAEIVWRTSVPQPQHPDSSAPSLTS